MAARNVLPPSERALSPSPDLPRPSPDAVILRGRTVDLERLDIARRGGELWHAIGARPALWDWVPPGPFANEAAFAAWLDERARRVDQALYAVVDKAQGRAAGLLFLVNIESAMGRAEIGVVFGPDLTRRTAGTEAFFLLARYVLATLGYRRLEWRCNPGNDASMRAAARFGFTFEGVLRQNLWLKGRNWDTAVHAMLDREWPDVEARLTKWLAPGNFDSAGRQKTALPRPAVPPAVNSGS